MREGIKEMKKLLMSSIMALLVSAVVLSGCSKGNGTNSSKESTNTPSTKTSETAAPESAFELGTTPVQFTFYGNYDWYTMPPWGNDLATAWIKENKKVNITPVQSGGDAATKYNMMIASNELPDVMWMERGPDVEKLREAGMLVSFDEYLDKYPNLKKWLGEDGINMLRSEDGKLYQFPNWYTGQPNGNAGYVINKKIYTELGSPALETTDDLYNYLKLVKEKYKNVVPFEVGLAAQGDGLDVLFSAFGEDYSVRYLGMRAVPKDDTLTSLFTDPVFRESMQYSNKLFREKLMTQDAMNQTADQVKEKVLNGRVAVFAGASPTKYADPGNAILKKDDPEAGYFMIWPIHKAGLDKNKIWPGTYNQLGWNVSVITKAAKDPEAIFAFLDWLTGPEGQSVSMWGPPGLYWDGFDTEGSPNFTEKYSSDNEGRDKLMAAITDFQWAGNTVFVDKSKAKFEMSLPEDKRSWATEQQTTITWKTQSDATQFVNLDPLPESEEGIIWKQLDDLFKEVRAKALLAKSEADVISILDKAEADAQSMGYSKLQSFMTDKWQNNLKKMNGN